MTSPLSSMTVVFPAYAGVSRPAQRWARLTHRIPRLCGGEPTPAGQEWAKEWYSPPMRGCAQSEALVGPGQVVFPAYAGVSRRQLHPIGGPPRIPRLCGGEPWHDSRGGKRKGYSPPMRG